MSISRSDYLKVVYGQLDDNIRSLINAQNINSLGNLNYSALQLQNNDVIRKAQDQTTASSTNDENWWTKFVDTVLDVGTNLVKGILNFGDAIFDFGVNVADAIAGGNNQWAKDITGYDWVSPTTRVFSMGGDLVSGRMFDSDYWTIENFNVEGSQNYLANQDENTYLNLLGENTADFIQNNLLQGIGFQIPSIALAAATGGGSAVAMGSMGAGALASQTNESYNETGDFARSLGSGVASALVEVGTELIGGKILKGVGLGTGKVAGIFGKEAISEAGESAIKTVAKTMLEEGFEETVSGALQPVVNSIAQGEKAFYNENGQNVYTDLDFWVNGSDSVLAQGMSGALIGGLFGGINQVQMRNAFGVDGTNFATSLEKMGNLQKQIENTQSASKRESLSQEYAMELSKARVYLENVRNKANSTQKANVLKLITNPSEMISTLKNQSDNEINSVIDTRIKELSNVNQFKARNFFNDLQDEFHTNYTLVFDEANNQNAYVDNQNNVIHISENLSEDLAPILVHEYLGHVIGDMIPNSSVNELFNQVKETSWYNSHYNELYKAYMNDENSQLFTSDTDKQAYYQKEVVNKYVEEAFKGNSNTSIRTIRELLKNQSKLTRFLNRLLNRESASMLENDNVVKEFATQIDRVLKFLNETNSNVVEKYLNGETLTSSEEKVVNKFKSFFDELDTFRLQNEYSKSNVATNDTNKSILKSEIENINAVQDTHKNIEISIANVRNDIASYFNLPENIVLKYKSAKILKNITDHNLTPNDITNVIYSSFSNPSYIFFSTKNNSFTFVSDNLNMATALNLDDLTIKTIFKNSRNNSYFENIQEGKNADKFMIYNKNEKECWASIATSPSQVKSIIDHNREVVNESNLKNKKPRFEYSKDLEPLETNEAVKVKQITDRSLNSVITLHGTREIYNQVIERIEKDFGISLKVSNKSAKARRLFEDFNLMNREFTKDNITRFIDDILNQNIDKSNTTFRDFLETKNVDVDTYVKSSANTLFNLLTDNSNPSTTSKRLTRLLSELKTARDNLQATNKVLRNNASMIRSLENRIKNYASDTTTVKGALNTLKSFISHIGFTKQGVLSASTLEHIRKLYQDGSFENMVKSILNPYQDNLQIENLTIQANALIELASDLSSSHIENNTLNASQIQNIGLLVRGVKKLYEDFNTGVIESARKEASNLIETAKQTKEVYKHSDSKLLQTANRLLLNYASPKTMFAFMLGGTNSDAFKSVYEDLYKKPYERQIKAYNEFKSDVLDNTKTLQKNRYAKVKGTKFRKYVIYQLYLNQKSPGNLTRLNNSTLSFTEREGVVKYYKFSELEKLINTNLSETEIKELDYLFDYYNKELKDYVEKSSEKILGFSVSRENYYPIVASDVFKTKNFSNPASIRYNISAMNNNRLKALTNNKTHIEINVDPINLFDDYIESMTITGEIGLESQKLNRLFQLKNDKGESLMSTISQYLPNAKTFVSSAFNKLIANTQVIERSGLLDKLIGRASVATLGLNPGTMLRQLGSLFTAARYTGGIANGIKTIINPTTYARIYKHRAWLKANNPVFLNRISNDGYVRGTTLSAGAMEFSSSALQKISRATMIGIEYMDRFTCYTTFEMAQDYVKAKYGYELNSEKNLNKANEIFTDILLDTQSNSDRIATSRLRAGEEGNFMKNLFGLFGSDNQNKLSILMQDAIDEVNIRNNKSYDESTRKALLTKNRKYIVTDTGALIVGAVFMALVNMLNDFLLDREEPETYDYSLLFFDSLKSMFDWTPYFGTMLNWFVYGGVDYFPIENLSELVETGGQLLDVVQNKKKFDKNLAMNLIIKMANMLGIPAENFQKYGLGILSNFSPKVAYQTRNMLYGVSQSYLNSEYSKGKESNNFNKMLNAFEMNSALYKATLSTSNATEIVRLKNKGLQINAYNVPETYTDKEGKEITLTEEERNNFKLVYDNLDGVLTKIINSSTYKSATDEEKASLINKAYQTYYEYALGRNGTRLSYLASLNGIDLSRIILGTNENNNLHLSAFEKVLVKFASGKSLKEEERYSLYLQLVKLGLNKSVAKELFDI